MTDELNFDDVEAEQVRRDENGELLPQKKQITWKGEPKTVKIVPATLGHANKYASLEEAINDLDPEAIAELFANHYRSPDFRDDSGKVPVERVRDLPLARLKELVAPLGLVEEGEQGNPPVTERDLNERELRRQRAVAMRAGKQP
jgi:hypothetical protein